MFIELPTFSMLGVPTPQDENLKNNLFYLYLRKTIISDVHEYFHVVRYIYLKCKRFGHLYKIVISLILV